MVHRRVQGDAGDVFVAPSAKMCGADYGLARPRLSDDSATDATTNSNDVTGTVEGLRLTLALTLHETDHSPPSLAPHVTLYASMGAKVHGLLEERWPTAELRHRWSSRAGAVLRRFGARDGDQIRERSVISGLVQRVCSLARHELPPAVSRVRFCP